MLAKMILRLTFIAVLSYVLLNQNVIILAKADDVLGLSLEGATSCFENPNLKPFKSFSVCAFLKLKEKVIDEYFVITFKRKGFSFYIGLSHLGIYLRTMERDPTEKTAYRINSTSSVHSEFLFEAPTSTGDWIRVCILYDEEQSQAKCFVEGEAETLSQRKNVITPVYKEIDVSTVCVGSNRFHGDIVGLQIMSTSKMKGQFFKSWKCSEKNSSVDPIFDYSDRRWSSTNQTTLKPFSRRELCERNASLVLLEPSGAFYQAHHSCSSMTGTLPSEDNLSEVILFSQGSRQNCMTRDNIISWILSSNVSGDTDSSATKCHAVNADNKIISLSCVRWLPCSLCFVPLRRYTLYGHLGNYYEYMYYLKTEETGRPFWEGIGGSRLEKKNGTWFLTSPMHSIRWYLNASYLPLGRFNWMSDSGLKKLFFSTCKTWQFGCDDGFCVDQNQRCDDVIDCKDRSDEDNCQVLPQPEGYDTLHEPPPRPNEVLPMTLFYHLNVYNLAQMTTAEGEARMDMGITMTWFDPRIKLYNLKHGKKNYFTCSTVWKPIIRAISGNGEGSYLPTNQYQNDCFAFPENDTEERSLADPYMAHTVDGTEHALVYYLGQLASTPCNFALYKYPFDVQFCNISFFVMNAPGSFVLRKDSPGNQVPYLNKQKDLLEYELISLTTQVGFFMQDDDNFTYIVLTMDLRRLYGYHITNSFFPSLLMMIIAYATYYFQVHDFTNRIMIALTAQLVLAALFTSTTESSVKTPYLKLIDLWYATIITFCSMITMSQVYINVLLNTSQVSWILSRMLFITDADLGLVTSRRGKKLSVEADKNEIGPLAAKRFNKFSQFLIAILVIVFIVIYGLLSIGSN